MEVTMKYVFFAIFLGVSVFQNGECRFNFRMTEKRTCQSVQNSLCSVLYHNTSMPNSRNHLTQEEASEELNQYLGLLELGCSNVLLHLLCAVYIPFCSFQYPEMRLEPCRDMCEHARDGCEHILNAYGLTWPRHLECSQYPDKTQAVCFGPAMDPSTVQMPSLEHLQTTVSSSSPQQLEIIGLEARVVTFYWEPPANADQTSSNNTTSSDKGGGEPSFNYLLSCDPQPDGFPYELSRIRGPVDITLSGFSPDTKYICSVFDTRSVTEDSAAMIEFRTPEDEGGSTSSLPENFRAKVLGPEDVLFTWNPPSTSEPNQPHSYVLSCHPEPDGFPIEFHDISGPIQDSYDSFEPNAMYNCGVYVGSLGQDFAVTTAFTTFDTLSLQFVHDTPLIEQGYIHLEFELSRPVLEASCQLLKRSPKLNCTSGVVSFFGLDPGSYTFRIVGENSKYDRFAERIRLNVPRASECIVHLFNSGLTQSASGVTVEFRSTGSLISGFHCLLDDEKHFHCVSPLHLDQLERGTHQLQITPLGVGNSCRRERPLLLTFHV